jgi:hypothetical protein
MLRATFLTLVLLISNFAFASSNPNSRAMDMFIESSHLDQSLDESYRKMTEAMVQQNLLSNELLNEYSEFLRENVSFKALEKDIRAIYADKFSETELLELAAFNHTSVGKKMIDLGPTIGTEVMILSQNKLNEKLPAFLKKIENKKVKAKK